MKSLWSRVRRPSPALLVACLALVASSAGSATAATIITGKQIRDSTVTGRDIRNKSLSAQDIEGYSGEQSPQSPGERGDIGPAGDAGAPGESGTQGELGPQGERGP